VKSGVAPGLVERVAEAWSVRTSLHQSPDTDVYRIFHGRTEGREGVSVSRVGSGAIIEHADALSDADEAWVSALRAVFPFEWILARSRMHNSSRPGVISRQLLWGTVPAEGVVVSEEGLRFWMQPNSEGHAGLFLDARPVRRWIRENSAGRRVLNLFSATGSLGVAAACGGALRVCHVDQQRNALETACENHALNHVPIDARDIVRGNLYPHLKRAAKKRQQFDAIVLDPPPVVPTGGSQRPVGQDYPALVRLVEPLLAPGAWLLCLFHQRGRPRTACEAEVLDSMSPAEFSVLWRGESGPDFPEVERSVPMRATAFARRA
jgi:23S rRNA (cytosine1962-C5)-methyltransferase